MKTSPITSGFAFRRWFGDSKVIDRYGRPLVVYHGTPDVRGLFVGGSASGPGGRWQPDAVERPGFKWSQARGNVFFATDSENVAMTYADDRRAWDYQNAEPAVVPLYLSIQNPMVIDAKGKSWSKTAATVDKAKNLGHDGIIIRHSVDYYNDEDGDTKPATVYAFFDPTQAKSALRAPLRSETDFKPIPGTGPNDGSFDHDDPDLRSNPPKIAVSDDDGELAVFDGDRGSASFWYGPASLMAGLLKEAGREETAEWVSDSGAGHLAWLTGIEVWKDQRGGGIGTRLMRRGLAELSKRGVEIVFLHAMADFGYEIRLAKWYKRFGFERRGEIDHLPFFYMLLDRPTKRRASRRRSSRSRK